MKNSNETIGNRTRDHPACSAVPRYKLTDSDVLFQTSHGRFPGSISTTLEDIFLHALRFSPVLLSIIISSLLFIHNHPSIIHGMQSRDNRRVVK